MFHFSALSAVVGLSLSIGALAAIGPVADLHIVNADIAPDGQTRPAVLAGGTFPGTLITGKKGDNFQLNVIDELTDETMLKSTSIHWHGFFQKGTNWADGPAFVTQCPITTNNSFLYNFDVPDQAGTFWYHSHLSTQYCDGLRGAFVVYDPYDPNADLYDVDDESTVITLADWYDTPVREIIGRAQFDATLINGLGRNAKGDLTAALAVITVERHKRYRFRLVSVSCDPNYKFSIENHPMTVIEVDGVNSQSLTVDSIQIFAGQRYSFILQANQPIGNYWIRANPNFGSTGFNNGINSAILRYVGAPEEEPAPSNFTSQTPLDETQLHPLYNPGVPGKPEIGGVDYAKNLLFSFSNGSFAIDNATFIPPNVPVLLQILSGAKSAQELMPKGSFIQLPPNSAIEISMPIPSTLVGVPHPFHLHGHNFHVVRSAGSTKYNFNDPVIRDVVNTGTPGDNVTIRFETNNPGPWFLHCHIDFHLEAGFALVFAEDIADTKAANPVPPAWDELCPKYDALGPGDL